MPDVYIDRVETNLAALEQRDAANDIQFVPVVSARFRSRRVVAMMHHPLPWFLMEMANTILKYISLPPTEHINSEALDGSFQLTASMPAISPGLHSAPGFEFPSETLHRGFTFKDSAYASYIPKYYSSAALIDEYYRHYDRLDVRGRLATAQLY